MSNNLKLSVIVPFYNSEKTLAKCLESICNSDYKNFEVIAIDDYSQDNSRKIAEKFPCKILIASQKGESYARNTGIKETAGDIIVSIDSDVVIKKDSLTKIAQDFKDHDITALLGLLSKEHPIKNFFSQYKNLYMNYIFNKMPKYVNFLYGSIFAVRKENIENFDAKTLHCAPDTDLGVRMQKKGHKILLDKGLEVIHLKKYTFTSFIINDFQIPFSWAYSFMKHKGYKYLFKEKRFAHAKLGQITSVVLSPLSLLLLFLSLKISWVFILTILLLFIILILHFEFLRFLNKERGFLFFLISIPVIYLDCLVMFCGIFVGFLHTVITIQNGKKVI